MSDLAEHLIAWRRALLIAELHAEVSPPDIDDKAYWRHEINALDRIAATLDVHSDQTSPMTVAAEQFFEEPDSREEQYVKFGLREEDLS